MSRSRRYCLCAQEKLNSMHNYEKSLADGRFRIVSFLWQKRWRLRHGKMKQCIIFICRELRLWKKKSNYNSINYFFLIYLNRGTSVPSLVIVSQNMDFGRIHKS